ncbi:MAG: ubiquinone biosynthesis protein UbiB, partial [Methyloceanibacter sp.]
MNAITNMARLTRAGAIIAWSGARVLPDEVRLPPPLRVFRRMTAPLRQEKPNGTPNEEPNDARLSTALTSLGP